VLEGNETVLLVADDDSVPALARAILRRGGYAALEAKSTDEAILLCEKHAPRLHLLLTDTVMPVMSGPELAIRLTAIAPNLKVLHMSGYTDAVVAHRMLERGIAFIQKPLTLRGLLLKVREVLDA
jgi:two-component system, cell cycle sensor histidine kinase and response regulator CckA